MIPRPWLMTPEQLASAEEAVRGLPGVGVAHLLRPALRAEHTPVVEAVDRLPWGTEPPENVAAISLRVLTGATVPGGPADPVHDDSDGPWAMMLARLVDVPAVGSRTSRRWFVHMERLRRDDAEVSAVPLAVAAYTVARFEDALGHAHEVWWWMQMAATQAEHDERDGLGLVVVVRAARLLTWRPS